MADMTYEEKLDGVTSFCDVYETCIEDAKPGTTLWAIGMLDDAWLDIMTVEDEYLVTRGDETIQRATEHIVDVMHYLCEKYAEGGTNDVLL